MSAMSSAKRERDDTQASNNKRLKDAAPSATKKPSLSLEVQEEKVANKPSMSPEVQELMSCLDSESSSSENANTSWHSALNKHFCSPSFDRLAKFVAQER
jgi:hypothetical protein